MLREIKISVDRRMVTVTNRETGNVIFSGSLDNLEAGTFTLANLPDHCSSGSPPPPTACTSWATGTWSACVNGTQTRTVTPAPTGCTGTPPGTQPPASQSCGTACTSWATGTWSACVNGTQTRTVTPAPTGCTGTPPGTQPPTSQACLDGAALYAANCSGCHGPLTNPTRPISGKSVSAIKAAGMSRGLTDAQLQAIVDVLP
jgi:mono/diheme cytochrome c family protein